MATLGLDTSVYEQGVEEAKAKTKESVSVMAKDYSRLYSEVLHLQAAYKKSVEETGKNSQATKDLKAKLSEAQAQLNSTSSALETAEKYMNSFGEKTKSTAESLTSAFAKAQLFTSAIQTIGRKALDMGKSFVQSGMDYNAQIETYRIALTNMLGDAEKANAFLNKIKQDAARTPFSTDSLVAANQYLLSAGENAEYSRKTILALGDAVKATGGGDDELNRMAQNLQQIANVGEASAVDIKQFAFAGINIYQVLADYTGKSVQDVQDMTITYDVLTQALQAAAEEGGRYYNAMGTQSQSLSGRMITLQDNASQLAGKLTTGLSSAYGSVVSKANEWVTSILENDEKLSQLQTTITVVISVVTAAAASFAAYKASMAIVSTIEAVKKATQGVTLAQAAMNAVMAANPIAIVVTLLAGLATALATAYATSETFRDKVNGAFSSVKSVADSAIGWVINKVRGLISAVAGAISALDALKNGEGWEAAQNAYVSAYQSKINSYEMADERKRRQKLHNERVKQSQEAAKNASSETVFSDLTGGGSGGNDTSGKTSTTTAAQKIAQVIDSLTKKSHQAASGITTDIQEVTEKYDDGTEHITRTVTESGTEIVDGVARNYKTVTTYLDDVQQKVEKTVEDIDTSVSAVQSKIDKNLSEAKSQWKNGILGTLQDVVSDLKSGNWKSLAVSFAKLIWGEVSQEQREIISKWAVDALTAINESYSGGGAKAAYESIKSLFTDGIAEGVTEAGTKIESFNKILEGLGGSGGAGAKIASVATSVQSMATSVVGSLGGIVSFITANPILALVLGIAGVAGGIGIASWLKKKKSAKQDTDTSGTSSALSYKDIQDAYWYGSQRSFAGYDFRTDGYAFGESPANGRLSAYQQKMQQSVDALYNVVQQYLPQTANTVIKLDDGTLVGALAPSIDAQLGQLATLAERGN